MAVSDYLRRWLVCGSAPITNTNTYHAPDGTVISLYKNWLELMPPGGQSFQIYAGQLNLPGGSLWARRGPYNGIYFVFQPRGSIRQPSLIGIGAELQRNRRLVAEPTLNLNLRILEWFYAQYMADIHGEQVHMDFDVDDAIPREAFFKLQLREDEEHNTW